MKLRRGDKVKVTTGKDKGKEGKITQVFVAENRAVVEGVNKIYKHLRPRQRGAKGERIELFAPVAISNLRLICPKCNKHTRIGHKMLEDKTKVRVCKNCGESVNQ